MPASPRIWFWAASDRGADSRVGRLLVLAQSLNCGVAPRLSDLPADAELVVTATAAGSAVRRVSEHCPAAAIVVAAVRPSTEEVVHLLESGARGVLDLTAEDAELHHALQVVQSLGTVVPAALQSAVATRLLKRRQLAAQREARIARLSPVETEILAMLAAGSDRAAVARQRGEPVSLVRTRIVRATAKLGVRSQRQALAVLAESRRVPD